MGVNEVLELSKIARSIMAIDLAVDQLNRNNADPGLRMYMNVIIRESEKISKAVEDVLRSKGFSPD